MRFIKPIIDKFVMKIKVNIRNIIEIIVFIFLIIDCLVTIWGIQTYQNRVVYNKINELNSNGIIPKIKKKIENDYFTNERMSETFPNLRIKNENGEEVWIKTLLEND